MDGPSVHLLNGQYDWGNSDPLKSVMIGYMTALATTEGYSSH